MATGNENTPLGVLVSPGLGLKCSDSPRAYAVTPAPAMFAGYLPVLVNGALRSSTDGRNRRSRRGARPAAAPTAVPIRRLDRPARTRRAGRGPVADSWRRGLV